MDGFVARSGDIVIEPQFEKTHGFSSGLAAAAVVQKGKVLWGYVTHAGAWAVQPTFRLAESFWSELATVYLHGGTRAYINKTGTVVWGDALAKAHGWQKMLPSMNHTFLGWLN